VLMSLRCRYPHVLLVVVLLTAGCGALAPPQPPDIEGTVTAAVEATLAARGQAAAPSTDKASPSQPRPSDTPTAANAAMIATWAAIPTYTPVSAAPPLPPPAPRMTATSERYAEYMLGALSDGWREMGVGVQPWYVIPDWDWLSIRLGRRSLTRIPMPSGSPAVTRWMPLPELCGGMRGDPSNCGVTLVIDTPQQVSRYVLGGTEQGTLGSSTDEWTGLISDSGTAGIVITHQTLGRATVSRMARRFLQETSNVPRYVGG
jgi:hypothetical protein